VEVGREICCKISGSFSQLESNDENSIDKRHLNITA